MVSLIESATIDGANAFYIFIRIIIPVSGPALATIALFNGVGHWNAWFDAAFFTTSPKLKTLQCILWEIINQANNQEIIRQKLSLGASKVTVEAVQLATMMVAVVPITFIYPFLQKYFIKGMMIGAIKG